MKPSKPKAKPRSPQSTDPPKPSNEPVRTFQVFYGHFKTQYKPGQPPPLTLLM